LGLVQILAGVDEIGRGAQRGRRTDAMEDAVHAVAVGHHVFAGGKALTGDQRLGKGPGPGDDRFRRHGRVLCTAFELRAARGHLRQLDDGGVSLGFRRGHPRRIERTCLHAKRKSLMACTWSSLRSIGAWPTPSNSTRCAFGPRSLMLLAVSASKI